MGWTDHEVMEKNLQSIRGIYSDQDKKSSKDRLLKMT